MMSEIKYLTISSIVQIPVKGTGCNLMTCTYHLICINVYGCSSETKHSLLLISSLRFYPYLYFLLS